MEAFFVMGGYLLLQLDCMFERIWTVILRDTQTLQKSTDHLLPVKAFDYLTWAAL